MEVDVTAQLDRSGFPYAARDDDVAAALFGELFDGFVERLGTIGLAVRHCAILRDVDRRRREFHFLHTLDLDRQIRVVVVVLTLCAETQRRAQQEGGEEDFFHDSYYLLFLRFLDMSISRYFVCNNHAISAILLAAFMPSSAEDVMPPA